MNTLSDSDFLRYQRQVALPEVGEEGQLKLALSRVLIIGCGGLASVVTPYLSGAGVGSLVIVDDDEVSISNLHRQVVFRANDIGENKAVAMKSQLASINPNVRVRAIDHRLSEEQLSLEVMMADIVVDCTDNFSTRQLINKICFHHKTMLVSGAANGFDGQFSVYSYSEGTACYRCVYSEESDVNANCSSRGVLGPTVGVIASLQALETIKGLLKLSAPGSPQSTHKLLIFNGRSLTSDYLLITKDPECPVCGKEQRSHES
ncbi:HesA/MoeB/ThiF family protein [Vibrio salinus]|uniref:HesA/MoeB/ThiF family protein n=1 Tax=Vibrio salinus TaxID=2899784 RepID=UPI001E60D65C|nr:HesA/MoeB/ThiF family protein [Vibrio salinus]MCE0493600.1 HesA/MoeB/ThiF family protein [Vibrio salinus]